MVAGFLQLGEGIHHRQSRSDGRLVQHSPVALVGQRAERLDLAARRGQRPLVGQHHVHAEFDRATQHRSGLVGRQVHENRVRQGVLPDRLDCLDRGIGSSPVATRKIPD